MVRASHVSCLVGLVAAAWGCSGEPALPKDIDELGRANAPRPEAPAATPRAPAGETSAARVHQGTVVEVLDVPHYTYLRLENGLWAAIPSTPVKVGQAVEVIESLVMADFHSKTLDRTFPSIVFGVLPGTGSAVGSADDHPPADGAAAPPAGVELPPGHPPIGTSPPVAP